ncbi:hypothetical protein DQ237_00220 [Blastococcus sp. TF02-8]|uniref:hypothetical protein n=1 Tax=Blastococcus sp. TF02-8 TaxID=2250574 RepID=UPI000DE951E9|nr:hypothetical protein [Blastococcus sp. TF02-8]RBY97433.1 hypothetical protein DQ237_00220 [Blastococcus sp. TF02-8]
MRVRTLSTLTVLATAGAVAVAAPASAAPTQEGLVNVNITDLTVQAPIAVVANICDVSVNVLAGLLADGAAPCDAAGDSDARVTRDRDGNTRQRGLVNVNLEDTTVQVPITVAANVCDVSVAVLTSLLLDGAAPCTSDADGNAVVTPL